jgi:type II secretory pathway component PulJ
MNGKFNKKNSRDGFTLAETLAALTVGSMVLIVVLAIYSRAQTGAAGVLNKLQGDRLPREVLQRIAEDLDRVVGAGQGTQINITNKFQDGLAGAKLEILKIVYDAKEQVQPLERIIWQSSIDPDSGVLTLYRSHAGIALEDKLLDEQKEPWQRELFVPVCTGLSFFRIEVPQGENPPLEVWSGEKLPAAITVILSFAEPSKMPDGTFEVPDEGKFIRTIAIDRTRMPLFVIQQVDTNQPADANQSVDANQPQPADEGVN